MENVKRYKEMLDTTFNTNAVTPEHLTNVNELCEKVAENPERHEAFLVQDEVGYVIPISKILEIAAEKHRREIEWYSNEVKRLNACLVGGEGKIDREIKDLRDTINTQIAKRDAIIKEMSNLLAKVNDVEYVDVTAWFDGCVDAEQQQWLDSAIGAIHECQLAFDGLIAKAREAVNG